MAVDCSVRCRRYGPWLPIAVAVLQLILVWWHRDPAMINPDSAQLVTAARNMLDGHGYATSALYYEQQQALGSAPAPLTNWPPGFALAMMPFVASGLSGPDAAFVVSAVGMVATVALAWLVGVAAGLRAFHAMLAACAVASLAHFSLLVVKSMTEPLFIATTLASALFLLKAEAASRPLRMLALAGAFGACAFLVRYAGLAWVVACLATLAVMHWRAGLRSLTMRLLAFGALPAIVVGGLFARNLTLVGSLTGGPALGGDTSLRAVLQSDYWAALRLFGSFGSPADPVVAALLGSLMVFGAYRVFLAAGGRRATPAQTSSARASDVAAVLAVMYGAFTLLLFGYLSFVVYPSFVEERYLVPLVPFGLLLGALLLQDAGRRAASRGPAMRKVPAVVFVMVVLLYGVGQVRVAARDWPPRIAHPQRALIHDLRTESIGSESVAAYLKQRVRFGAPLMVDDGQVIAALIGIPTVGLPERRFSRKSWNEQEVAGLMRVMGSCLLLVHPGSLGPPKADWPVFFEHLSRDGSTEWLETVVRTPRLHLYRANWCPAS